MPDANNNLRAWDLCVDFGSSATAAAQAEGNNTDTAVVALGNDSATLRSAIYIESPERIDVGDVAFDKAQRNPTGLVAFPKFAVAQGVVHAGGFDVPAAVAISAVLGTVVARAAKSHGGVPPRRLVLTHPEAWHEQQIDVLVSAAKRLELEDTEVVTRSEAHAAASYYSKSTHLPSGATIAVVDFGGGTLDTAVLRSNEDGSFTVLSSHGADDIGGRTIDALLRGWLDERLAGLRPDLLGYLRSAATADQHFALENSIRRAKEILSESRSTRIAVPGPNSETFSVEITRTEFEQVIDPLIRAARDLTAHTLSEGGVSSPYELEALYLVGGSSRIPLVHRALADLGPIATLDDPKTIVAQGALGAAAPVARHLAGSVNAGSTERPTEAKPPNPLRRGIAVGATALVGVIVLVAAATFAVVQSGSDNGEEDAQSEVPAPVLPAKYEKDMRAAISTELSDVLTECEPTTETKYGGVTFRCDVDASKSPVEGAFIDKFASVEVTADEDNAEVELQRIKLQGGSTYYADEGSTLIQSEDESAAARIDGSGAPSMQVAVSNTETHLVVESYDFTTPDKAEEFLEKTGLLPS